MDNKVHLRTIDEQLVSVDKELLQESLLLSNMLEDLGDQSFDSETIPLQNTFCTLNNMNIIFQYLQTKDDKPFYDMEPVDLLHIIQAANYLDIKNLFELTCKIIAQNKIKHMSIPEIKKLLDFDNIESTEEEKKNIEEELSWCDYVDESM